MFTSLRSSWLALLQRATTSRSVSRFQLRSSSETPWSNPIKRASGFIQKLKSDLPIIGLVSKLTSPVGLDDESEMTYQEFSRNICDSASGNFNGICFDIQDKYGSAGNLRFLLFVLWMARQSFGSIPPKSIVQSATRLRGSRDLEYEISQFEALREEEKQNYGFGASIDYTPKNVVPTSVDALVRLVLGLKEEEEIPVEAEELLTTVITSVFPDTNREEIENAFKSRNDRAYLYK